MRKLIVLLFILLAWQLPLSATQDNKTFNISVRDASLNSVLEQLAKEAGYELVNQSTADKKVSYEFESKSFSKIIGTISRDSGFQYKIEGKRLVVSGINKTQNGFGVTRIPIHYVKAEDVKSNLPKFLREGDSVGVDTEYNALVFYGSPIGLKRVKDFAAAFDRRPEQVYIEAQIVETSYSVSQDLGFTYGDLTGSASLGNRFKWSGSVSPTVSSSPNLTLRYFIGNFSGNQLEAQLIAAESRGKVKIVSRPKIVTLNNQTADIHSGVTYNVKTLTSSTVTDDSGDQEGVTGGLEEITAGLDLKVKPNVVEDGKIKLMVEVINSEPDDTLAVDGIPGIVDNSAKSSLIVNDGDTVSLVGLMKTNISSTETGIPWLRRIPLLGILFGGYNDSDTRSELVVFITPRIVSADDIKKVETNEETERKSASVSGL